MSRTDANITVMRRGSYAIVGIGLLIGCAPPASSSPTPGDGPYRVQMVYRVGKSLAPFDITIATSTDNDFGMRYALELVRDGKGWVERVGTGFGGYANLAGTLYPEVYGPPGASTLPACPDMPGCKLPVPRDGSRGYTVAPVATSRYYVISTHATVRVEISSPAWRVKDVPNPGVRRVLARTTTATGAGLATRRVEHFTSASAPGGRYGSSVFAAIPCDQAGEGSARITGRGAVDAIGNEPRPLRCGSSLTSNDFFYSRQQTTWKLEGDVTGVTAFLDRLVVFDWPKP